MTTHHHPELDRIELGKRVVNYYKYPTDYLPKLFPDYSWGMDHFEDTLGGVR